jgi:hypothetical protein
MSTAARRIALILTVAVTPAAADVATTGYLQSRPALELVGLDDTQSTMVTRAVALYAEAGLDLPPLVFVAGDPVTGCGGHDGLHHPHDGWSEIDLCVDAETAAVFHTVLHEIAHAWATNDLDPQRKAAFMDQRDVTAWQDYETLAWEDNGTEQAAEIISWGVSDVPAPTVRIGEDSCAELLAGYEALTGVAPSYGLTDVCSSTTSISRF